jgi:hypothetical protein
LFLFQAAGVPVDFETFFFSEVHHTMSAPLEDVAKSISTNGICLKVKKTTEVPFYFIDNNSQPFVKGSNPTSYLSRTTGPP